MEWKTAYLASPQNSWPWRVGSLDFENRRFHAGGDVLSSSTWENVATPTPPWESLALCCSQVGFYASTLDNTSSHMLNVAMKTPGSPVIVASRESLYVNQLSDVFADPSIDDLIGGFRCDATSCGFSEEIDANFAISSLLTTSAPDMPTMGDSTQQDRCDALSRCESPNGTLQESVVDTRSTECRHSCKAVCELEEHQNPSVVFDQERKMNANRRAPTKKGAQMKYAELSEFFNMPISEASKKLKIGVTVLKKKCREFGVSRWPHRKIKSLDSLIRSIQDSASANGSKVNDRAILIVKTLEEERKLIHNRPETQLNKRIKRLRQASFKNKCRSRRKQLEMDGGMPDGESQTDETNIYGNQSP